MFFAQFTLLQRLIFFFARGSIRKFEKSKSLHLTPEESLLQIPQHRFQVAGMGFESFLAPKNWTKIYGSMG